MSLDAALHRLLFDRTFRESFLRGDFATLGLSTNELDHLSSIDEEQLRRASRLACDGILHRSHRGTGSIVDTFPETIAAWQREHPGAGLDVLADEFAASPHCGRYRALPTCEGAISLEEAFWRFAEDHSIGDPITRTVECATTLLKALAITHASSFALPSFVVTAPRGYFAILGQNPPMLLAATEGRFIRGPVTDFLAALLTSQDEPSQIAERFEVGRSDLERSRQELQRLGLLA
jgi:hypothetical protein